MVTTKDAIEFVLKYRNRKTFKNMSTSDIIHAVHQAIQQNCFAFSVSATGTVNGVILGSVIPEQNVVFVTECLTSERGVIRNLLAKLYSFYPSFRAEARRHGKIKRYNTAKLIKKFHII